ncbi:MAG: M23 family metallopeptidase, partial [Patescibacteria group bacterium]
QTLSPQPINKKFLICPIKGSDANGQPLTSHTVKISAVLDHSGTVIDFESKNHWGKSAKDKRVKAFNGEVGENEPTFSPPFGYSKTDNTPFLRNAINYVGVYDAKDKYQKTCYLNYDGHAGYDFPYSPGTPVVAPANGLLFKAAEGKDKIYGANWSKDHSFYIEHANGFITWFRHCEKMEDKIENEIGSDSSKHSQVERGQVIAHTGKFENWKADGTSPHLHFEVRNSNGNIVDPYLDELWEV